VQLLPTLEAASRSTRALNATAGGDLGDTVLSVLELFGPSLGGATPLYDWEYRSCLGVLWVVAALLAPALCPGRVRFQAAVCGLVVGFALGGGNLLDRVPGFRLFPMHIRMMVIAALPLAYLAGVTTQVLFADPGSTALVRRLGRRLLLIVLALALLGLGVTAFALGVRNLRLPAYWATLPATIPIAAWLFGRGPEPGGDLAPGRPGSRLRQLWGVLLLVELWAISRPEVEVRPVAEIMATPQCVRFLAAHRHERGRVLDRTLPGDPTKSPLGSALALALRIEQVRGYDPFNFQRFQEYLQFLSDRDRHVGARRMIENFPILNKSLLDLLGVRYVLQPTDPSLVREVGPPIEGDPGWRKVDEDPSPRAFIHFEGLQDLPSYSVYENRDVLPRAFVVPEAAPLPDRPRVLEALKANDFRRRVLLEGLDPVPSSRATSGGFRPAEIREYLPNRVTVAPDGGPPGYLVLTDVWFPGWTCEVDGRPARLFRANFLFRAVSLPAGAREVVFTFSPASYRLGKVISAVALAAVTVLCLAILGRRWPRRRALPAISSHASGTGA
jgi:hypothetical protein